MAIFKRGKTWWIDFATPKGERIRRSSETTDRKLAKEFHDKLKVEIWRQEQLKERPRRTWDETALKWLEGLPTMASKKDNAIRIKWLQGFLRGKFLDEITRGVITEIQHARAKDTEAGTVNRYLSVIRSVLRIAVEWEWIDTVPMVKALPVSNKRIRWLTREEVERLLSQLPEHQADIAKFALGTGLRKANVLGLEWSQVDLPRQMAWVHPDQAKGKKAIGVPLSMETITVLRKQEGNHPRFVFTFEGRPIRQVNTKAWRAALKRAGIYDFRWHDLRHTWASWHVQNGTPLPVLQELGGWSKYEMVQRYAHLSSDHLTAYADNASRGTNTAQPKLKAVLVSS